MKKLNLPLALLAIAVLCGGSEAFAQATRTWVSGVGDDVNPCSRTAPCKTFAGAISKTAAGGEISALDPGGFGAVTITKSITINGDGTLAGILASLTNGIIVNAGVNDKVVIRNVSINGAGNGLSGIRYLAGKQLVVENVSISGFTTRGIDVALAAAGTLTVKDTNITNATTGIRVNTTGGLALVSLDNVHFEGQTTGLEAVANSRVTVSNSVFTRHSQHGILANSATAQINVEGSQVSFNDLTGINAAVSGAFIRISNNEIYNNSVGISFAGGATVESANNNRIGGNTSSMTPNALTTID
jgi:Right handed beta helix region